jgi:hypothetical protein
MAKLKLLVPTATYTTTTTMILWMGGMNNYDKSTSGTNVAPYLLLAFSARAVLFTIPMEFQRTQWCSIEETVQYPMLCSTTLVKWSHGIQDHYYANGGGIKSESSVAKAGDPWAGDSFREE